MATSDALDNTIDLAADEDLAQSFLAEREELEVDKYFRALAK